MAPWPRLAARWAHALASGTGMDAPHLLRLARAGCSADKPVLYKADAFLNTLGKPGDDIWHAYVSTEDNDCHKRVALCCAGTCKCACVCTQNVGACEIQGRHREVHACISKSICVAPGMLCMYMCVCVHAIVHAFIDVCVCVCVCTCRCVHFFPVSLPAAEEGPALLAARVRTVPLQCYRNKHPSVYMSTACQAVLSGCNIVPYPQAHEQSHFNDSGILDRYRILSALPLNSSIMHADCSSQCVSVLWLKNKSCQRQTRIKDGASGLPCTPSLHSLLVVTHTHMHTYAPFQPHRAVPLTSATFRRLLEGLQTPATVS